MVENVAAGDGAAGKVYSPPAVPGAELAPGVAAAVSGAPSGGTGAFAAAPFRGSGPFLAKAPPLSIPMRHFAAAALAFWTFAAAFAWGHGRFLGFDYQALWVLGLAHTLTLGWITMTLFGAMSQLAPVLWEVSLAGHGAVKAAWWLFAAGTAGFVGCLWAGSLLYWIPAVFLVAAVWLYLYVFIRTMLAAPKLDWTGKHLALAVGYLAVLVVLGLLLAHDRHRGILFGDPEGALIAHVHLALIGWVSLSIMGVSYRLVSMFALSHLENKTPGRWALGLVNAGLLGLAVDALFFRRRLLPLWAFLLVSGYAAYAWQMREIFNSRNRRIDPALSFTVLALAGGAVWAALGLGLASGWIEDTSEARLAYVFAALVGWITPFILGQIHKIVPFLVWLHVYSPKQWRPPLKIPRIQDLTSEKLAWAELALLAPGVYACIGGFLRGSEPLLRAGSLLIFGAATLYVGNTGLTLFHLIRRDPRWIPPSARQ